jgi:hypothetical protein
LHKHIAKIIVETSKSPKITNNITNVERGITKSVESLSSRTIIGEVVLSSGGTTGISTVGGSGTESFFSSSFSLHWTYLS